MYLKVKEAAAQLGIAEITMRKWIAIGKVRVVRLSPRSVRIDADEISRLVAGCTVPPDTREAN